MIRDIHSDPDPDEKIGQCFVYILHCSDGSYYTGSTIDIWRRIDEHNDGKGANHTRKHLPVEIVYYEEHTRIDVAFIREKQIQGWSRKKKEALIENNKPKLPKLARCKNDSTGKNKSKDLAKRRKR